MAVGEARIEIVGTVTRDPELRFTPTGAAVVNFSVAVNGRQKDQNTNEWKEVSSTFYRVSAWRQFAENIAESLNQGDRVIVHGTVKLREWESDGKSGSSLEVEADAVGPDLRFATARTQKAQRQGGQGQDQGQAWGGAPQQQAQGGAWAPQQGQGAPAWAGAPQGQPQGPPQGQQQPQNVTQQPGYGGPQQGQQAPPQDPWQQPQGQQQDPWQQQQPSY